MTLEDCLQMARAIPYVKGQSRHFAAVVDKRERLVSSASNDYSKTHTIMHKTSRKLGLFKDFCHAEQLALVRARGRGVKLIVVRVGAKGEPLYSAPCLVCSELLRNSQIKSIEYTL